MAKFTMIRDRNDIVMLLTYPDAVKAEMAYLDMLQTMTEKRMLMLNIEDKIEYPKVRKSA